MSRRVHLLAVPLLLLAALITQGSAPPVKPLPSEIAAWIEDLGADTFAEREAAEQKLKRAGRAVLPALKKASSSKDAEIARRAKKILVDFRWGIFPDTPPAIVKLIKAYQAATNEGKRGIIRKLFAAGAEGCQALAYIADAETDVQVRQILFEDIAAELARGAAVLLEKNKLDALESLLEIALTGKPKTAIADYSAFHLLRGSLNRRIAYHQSLVKKNPAGKEQARIVAHLHRANGDLTKALASARYAEDKALEEAILFEKADWKTLAAKDTFLASAPLAERLGLKAAYLRLSGQTKEYGETLAELNHEAKLLIKAKTRIYPEAKSLFLNGAVKDAIDLLDEAGGDGKLRFEVRMARLEVDKALELVAAARKDASKDLPELEILEARTLVQMGEKEKGKKLFKSYADRIKRGNENPWSGDLVKAEWDAGLDDDAIAHAGKIIETSFDDGWPMRLLPHFFGDDADTAIILWGLLIRADANQKPEARLKRVRTLMDGKADQKELTKLADKIDELKKTEKAALIALFWYGLGEAAKDAKQPKLAEKYLTASGTTRAGISLGDLAAQSKKWKEAAKKYLDAYKVGLSKTDLVDSRTETSESVQVSLALWLAGWALEKSGQKEEGKKRKEQAHLLPLGNGEVRYDLAKEFARRGQVEATRREQFLLRRIGQPLLREATAFYTSEGFRGLAMESMTKKDYLAAADALEQAYLMGLQPSIRFTRDSAHVNVPANNLFMRARGLLAKGQTKEALAMIELARQVQPASVDLAIRLVPQLEKAGKKTDAQKLAKSIIGEYDKLIKKYPKWAFLYNQAAWTSACTRAELNKGLTYAKKAVELSPKQSAYHDTMAEVLFQLGKTADAIAAQKKAIELRPKYEYFKKQLKRFEKGDPKTPRPNEE